MNIKNALSAGIVAAMISGSAMADTDSKKIAFCTDLSKTAGKIMSMRQRGFPMSKLMEVSQKHGNLYVHIVKTAYATPRRYADENIQIEIEDFENEIFSECLKYTPNK